MPPSRPSLRRSVALAATGGLAVALAAVPTAGAAAAAAPTPFRAGAWATTVTVDGLYTADKTAPVGTGCSPRIGTSRANSLVSAQAAGLLSTGTLRNTATVTAGAGGAAVTTARSQIQGVSLLNGLVSIGTLTSQSSVTARPDGTVTASAAGTSLASLSVAGIPVLSISPNLRISLPGVGYLLVNEQIPAPGGGLVVNLVHLYVAATDTEIIVGHSAVLTGFDGPLQGVAYTAQADVANAVSLGRLSGVSVGCNGTNGRTRTNTLSTVALPGFGSAGVATNSSYGIIDYTALTATARTQSTLAQVGLTNILSARSLVADIEVNYADGGASYVDRSTFADLTVLGQTLPVTIAPNTVIALVPGVTLYLHRVITTAGGTEVRMIQLVVSGPNSLGLDPLLDLRIGVARVGVDAD